MLRLRVARLKLELEERMGRKVPWAEVADATGISEQVLSSLASRGRVVVTNMANVDSIWRFFSQKLGRPVSLVESIEADPESGLDGPIHVDKLYPDRRRRKGED